MMALYKQGEGKPGLAGCLPIVIQIPVFFALYKVLFVAIEMRHAPFYGWIQDLSAPDPYLGVQPVWPDSLGRRRSTFMLGIWPHPDGHLSMFAAAEAQPSADRPGAGQGIFCCAASSFSPSSWPRFPAGLVIYWTWNNTAVDHAAMPDLQASRNNRMGVQKPSEAQ